MARTDSTMVKSVLLADYNSRTNPSLTIFISTATSLVDRLVVAAAAKSLTLTLDELLNIETWLAAHFYKQTDKAYASNKTDVAEAVYQGRTAMKLQSTLYGQTALMLDWTGCLNDLMDTTRKVGAFWLGKTDSEKIDYENRN